MRPDLSNLDVGGPATNRDIRRVAHGYEPRREATMAAFAKELAEGITGASVYAMLATMGYVAGARGVGFSNASSLRACHRSRCDARRATDRAGGRHDADAGMSRHAGTCRAANHRRPSRSRMPTCADL
jgi:hypothetical protein